MELFCDFSFLIFSMCFMPRMKRKLSIFVKNFPHPFFFGSSHHAVTCPSTICANATSNWRIERQKKNFEILIISSLFTQLFNSCWWIYYICVKFIIKNFALRVNVFLVFFFVVLEVFFQCGEKVFRVSKNCLQSSCHFRFNSLGNRQSRWDALKFTYKLQLSKA